MDSDPAWGDDGSGDLELGIGGANGNGGSVNGEGVERTGWRAEQRRGRGTGGKRGGAGPGGTEEVIWNHLGEIASFLCLLNDAKGNGLRRVCSVIGRRYYIHRTLKFTVLAKVHEQPK